MRLRRLWGSNCQVVFVGTFRQEKSVRYPTADIHTVKYFQAHSPDRFDLIDVRGALHEVYSIQT